MACSAGRLLSALTGISVSALSSSHRWRSEDSPSKLLSGTREMRLASRRLVEKQDGDDQFRERRRVRVGMGVKGSQPDPSRA